MKNARTGLMVVAGLLMAAALSAHAQGGAASAPAATAVPQTGSASAPATPTSSRAADRALRRRVLTALGKAKGLRAAGITVRATNGAVMLEGWVPEQAMIDQATQVAQAVPGVTSVKNTLTLSTF